MLAGLSVLRSWSALETGFLADPASGHFAMKVVASCGAELLRREDPAIAGRIAFAAVWRIIQDHPDLDASAGTVNVRPEAAHALSVFRTVQDWSLATGRSAFAAALSRDVTEALARLDAAWLCDRIAEQHDIGDRASVTCWFQAAHREAFRAVMRCPHLLAGEDSLREEMIRVGAAAHLARLARAADARAAFGWEEAEGMAEVEQALQRSSRLAIGQQKARNRMQAALGS